MLVSQWLAVTLAVAPSLVSAALFPKDSLVKHITPKQFKKALKENSTTVVAFVAPWCGHCQRMAPEYSKAALGLYPLVPMYAVDCDNQNNKRLCAEQGVQGFPTIKLWPRGEQSTAMTFDGPERTASAFYYWASRAIPHGVKKLYKIEDIPGWVNQNIDHTRALLVNNGKHIPLLWQVLGNKYKDHFKFAIHRDRKGKSSVKMGMEAGEKGTSKVLIYPPGSTDFVRFQGITKLDSLTKFFDSIVDGTADLTIVNAEAAKEEYVPDETELEIERKQEAQRIALAHGGFTELVDFEEAIKQYGTDFHGKHGYPGMMGGGLPKKSDDEKAKDGEKPEDPIARILRHQKEEAKKSAEAPKMVKTGDGGQVVFEAETETGHPKTPMAVEEPAASETTVAKPVETTAESTEHVKDEL
ncbi:hypothetical protein C8Q75DRAFT_719079 [Abortiporus biennis]|nr:hypothetical protein C8Q75DRAFT_719079 [Abortiporus biennis]